MRRVTLPPREGYAARLEEIGLSWHALDGGAYWGEGAAYAFTPAEIERIEAATSELVRMCFDTVEDIVSRRDFAGMGIEPTFWSRIERSWAEDEPTLYGRMDLALTRDGQLKLLEFNADTPTSLLEAAVAQWHWLEDRLRAGQLPAGTDQFNRVHEALIEQFTYLREARGIHEMHFASAGGSEEDFGTVQYLRDTAQQAGLRTTFLHVHEIGHHPVGQHFVGRDGEPIRALFKLYPLEWMMAEEFGTELISTHTVVVEPLWKALLSNKAILARLWARYPGHDLLLPAFLEPGRVPGDVVRKPIFSREGASVTITGRHAIATAGEYGAEGHVEQAYVELPEFTASDGTPRYPVLGSWVIGQDAAGLGVREGRSRVTDNTASFCPHFIDASA